MPVYGYARVQAGRSLKKQVSALAEAAEQENIVTDGDGSGFAALKAKLRPGDLLVIRSLDQLGNSYESMFREWVQITEKIGADILVLEMPLLDTRKASEGVPVSGIVQEILGFAAARDKKRTKLQAQGIRKAKERGVRFGRPSVEYTPEFVAAAEAYRKKQITLQQALHQTGVKKSAFYYHLKRLEELGLLPNGAACAGER